MNQQNYYFNIMKITMRDFFDSNNKLNAAADEALDMITSKLTEKATRYSVSLSDLNKKFENMRQKIEYERQKLGYERAIAEYSTRTSLKTFIELGSENNVSYDVLVWELTKLRVLNSDYFYYDRKVNTNDFECMFTYSLEKLLLSDLESWKIYQGSSNNCTCQHCALLRLSKLAYNFLPEDQVPFFWYHYRRVNIDWLKEFQMRHSKELIEIFGPFTICYNETPPCA